MGVLYGLKVVDLVVIVAYFAIVMLIGFWASRRVKNDEDYYLGGRRFGKGLLMMHWLCTGTHSEMAVQVAGATARVGLGGIWYQWMWLFSTPFYWLIAPVIRRLRVITTGDFFRIRYGRSLEMVYAIVALLYLIQSIALLLRGAGAAIAGATGGDLPTEQSVILLSIIFSTYVVAGGLMAAAYTDLLQGVMIIVLSVLLVPVGMQAIGGFSALHEKLGPEMMSITAPDGALEGHLGFIIAMSLLGLTGVVVQPHVMNATGSGKTELESRVGMTYGNFIKRVLTIAWSFTGLVAVVMYADLMSGVPAGSAEAKRLSETLFGHAIRDLLGDGWRGLMIACIVAGVTSAETFMVVGAGIFTRNFYRHVANTKTDRHYLWVGRVAAAAILVVSIAAAFLADSVTQLVLASVQIIGLLGAAFWLGIIWRRANATAVWCSFVGSVMVWACSSANATSVEGLPGLHTLVIGLESLGDFCYLRGHTRPVEIIVMLGVQFGVLILISLVTRPQSTVQLDLFYARLLTPVGKEKEVATDRTYDAALTIGLAGKPLDFKAAESFGYSGARRFGLEIPRLTWIDWGGFLLAWAVVAGLIVMLVWLASP